MSKVDFTELMFIGLPELKKYAQETIDYFETTRVGARMMNDYNMVQAADNAIAALQVVMILPDDYLEKILRENGLEPVT